MTSSESSGTPASDELIAEIKEWLERDRVSSRYIGRYDLLSIVARIEAEGAELATLREQVARLTRERDDAGETLEEAAHQATIRVRCEESRAEAAEKREAVLKAELDELRPVGTEKELRRERDEALALAEAMRGALSNIVHTFTEDSHGNMKTLDACEYQKMARSALSLADKGGKP